MRVLKALLARACIPLCFIQILKFESGQILPSDIVFLYILMMFTTVWICDILYIDQHIYEGNVSRLLEGTAFINCMIYTFFITHDFFRTGTDARKYLLTDYGFPFLNFNQLLQWTCYELWCLVFFIYSYSKRLGASTKKLLICLLYLSVHATVVIFLMECIALVFMTQVYLTLHDNFYYTFDANSSGAYPTGYLDPLILDKSLYAKPTMKTEFYKCPLDDIYSTCSLTMQAEDNETVEYPFRNKVIYRFTGEDVEMMCEFGVINKSVEVARMYSPVWYLNDSVIANGARHSQVHWYNPIGESVNVVSLLKIKFLKDTDFGEYICSSIFKTLQYACNEYGYLEEYKIQKPTLNVFSLKQIKIQPQLIYRVVGNLITSENFFWYHSKDDIDDMTIAYTINDRPVDEVCPGFQTQTCSLGAAILRNFISFGAQMFKWNGAGGFPFIKIGEMPLYGLKRGIVYFCLCSSGYGIHRISFLRKVYTGLPKKFRNEEIVHPFIFIVLPLSTASIFRLHDDTHLYSKIEKLVQEESNFDVIEDEVKDVIEFVKSNEEKVFALANVIQAVILICCVVFFYSLTLFVSNLYVIFFIKHVTRKVFIPQLMLPDAEPLLAIEQYEFDIFLSYAEEEDNFVTEELVPFLEDECNLRTCIPRRDFSHNRSIFGSFVDKIQKSRKVVVILSESYMADARCVHLQLGHIIMPSLYEHIRDQQNILILRYDTIPVPDLLRWNFQIEVFKWYELLPMRVKLQILKKWFYFGHI